MKTIEVIMLLRLGWRMGKISVSCDDDGNLGRMRNVKEAGAGMEILLVSGVDVCKYRAHVGSDRHTQCRNRELSFGSATLGV